MDFNDKLNQILQDLATIKEQTKTLSKTQEIHRQNISSLNNFAAWCKGLGVVVSAIIASFKIRLP